MITQKHLAAALGFAFAAAWIGLGFGAAILCLVGAVAFYYAASFLEGELDLGDLQSRFGNAAPNGPHRNTRLTLRAPGRGSNRRRRKQSRASAAAASPSAGRQ